MKNAENFYIGGVWVPPLHPHTLPVINPSTEEVITSIALGSQADTNAAIASAKSAFRSWRLSSKNERLDLLESILGTYNRCSDEISAALSSEMGAPIDFAKDQQFSSGTFHLRAFIEALKEFEFERPLRAGDEDTHIIREPIGVCGLITPWNWPINQIMLKVIPALATGCTMVLKPSELSPLSGILFSEVLHEAGVPAGVYNMLNGDGPGVGSHLSSHPDIDMISFTGSTRAGRAISIAAAETIKRVSLELGGKGANVIFADADKSAVKSGVLRGFRNTGQSCNAPTRILVERSRYDQAVEEAREVAESVRVNLASIEGNHIGPLISELQFNKVQGLIERGIREGAKLVAGGLGRPSGLNRGYFARPTVFADCSPDMDVMREEIFGPVVSMMPFDTEEEAIQITNDTVYGLTNYVQSSDVEKARRFARIARSGMVDINGNGSGSGAPFGGMKQSGNGREGGVWGFEEFTEVRSIGGWTT